MKIFFRQDLPDNQDIIFLPFLPPARKATARREERQKGFIPLRGKHLSSNATRQPGKSINLPVKGICDMVNKASE